MKEEWRKIPDFDRYEISNLGRVRSFVYFSKWKILNTYLIGNKEPKNRNYQAVYLYKKGENRKFSFVIHRLLYTLFIGPIPHGMHVDHKDGNAQNNDLTNLRLATNGQNRSNSKLDKGRKFKGVYARKEGYFVAQIVKDYKNYYLGMFDTAEEAAKAYDEAATRLHGEFARTNEMQ